MTWKPKLHYPAECHTETCRWVEALWDDVHSGYLFRSMRDFDRFCTEHPTGPPPAPPRSHRSGK